MEYKIYLSERGYGKMNFIEERNKDMFNKGAEKGYICTCCGDYTSLNNSASHRGDNLICYPCIYKMERALGFTVSEVIALIQSEGEKRNKFD